MIQIKQREGKWRLKIVEEEWEFETQKDMKKCLDGLLEFKQKSGQLKEIDKNGSRTRQ